MDDEIAKVASELNVPIEPSSVKKDPRDSFFERKKEDPEVKRRKKAEAKSRKINRKIASKKRKPSSHKRRK